MHPTIAREIAAYRRTFAGQAKNVLAILTVPAGLFFWFRDRNLVLAIPMAVLSPLLLQAPSQLYRRVAWLHEGFTIRLLKIYESSLVLILTLSTAGSAYLFYLKYQFDILVHFLENFLISFLVILALSVLRMRKGKSPRPARKAALAILLFGLAFSLSWEVYQFSCDRLIGSQMAFDSYQTWFSDTASDFLGGALGLVLGSLFICLPFWDYLLSTLHRNLPRTP